MGTVDKLLWYIFALSALLIAVVYFVGLSTDAQTLFDSAGSFVQLVTGRDKNNNAVQYPTTPAKAA